MINFSKNRKLNNVLNFIYKQLEMVGVDEVVHYYNEFKNEIDYNLVEHGNLYIYYFSIREMYQQCGYISMEKMSDEKIWETYKRQVGYVARFMVKSI